jgi:hypothetical protein
MNNEIDIEMQPVNDITIQETDSTNYNSLKNLPKINGVTVQGERPGSFYGLASAEEVSNSISAHNSSSSAHSDLFAGKQDTLVNQTNIKSINNTSLLGSGNITLDVLPSQSGSSGKFLTTDGSSASWANPPIATVDQTYNGSSTNAQSGVAMSGELANYVKNNVSPTLNAGSGYAFNFETSSNNSAKLQMHDTYGLELKNNTSQAEINLRNNGEARLKSRNNDAILERDGGAKVTVGASAITFSTRPNVGGDNVLLISDISARIVETYHNGTSWYRVWSDGWCEQGGYASGTGGENSNYVVNLLKSYNNDQYSPYITFTRNGNTGSMWGFVHNLSGSSFQVVKMGNDFFWSTRGYITEE